MRYLRYLFLTVVGVVLVTVALANRQPVTIRLAPDEFSGFLPFTDEITVPLFLIILGGIIVGLLIGFVWEYFREYKLRSEANKRKRQMNRLEREVQGLREKTGEGKDDVLALLE